MLFFKKIHNLEPSEIWGSFPDWIYITDLFDTDAICTAILCFSQTKAQSKQTSHKKYSFFFCGGQIEESLPEESNPLRDLLWIMRLVRTTDEAVEEKKRKSVLHALGLSWNSPRVRSSGRFLKKSSTDFDGILHVVFFCRWDRPHRVASEPRQKIISNPACVHPHGVLPDTLG